MKCAKSECAHEVGIADPEKDLNYLCRCCSLPFSWKYTEKQDCTAVSISRDIAPDLVNRLNSIINNTGAVCVISSTWREQHTLGEIRDFLTEAGFTGEVIGMTPIGGWNRACEIEEWLKTKGFREDLPDVRNFIILDDNPIHEHPEKIPHLMECMIQTDWADGLQDHHVTEAIELLR
jgi:hypothetical protein